MAKGRYGIEQSVLKLFRCQSAIAREQLSDAAPVSELFPISG